jgi:hypothetical protein
MIDFLTALREFVPIFSPVPSANNSIELLVFAFQYDPFEVSLFVAAVLLDIAAAAEMLAFLEHGRNHENDLRPLAWVRYVVYGFALIQNGSLKRDSVTLYEKLSRYLGAVAFFGAAGSIGYYNFAVSTVPTDIAGGVFVFQLIGIGLLALALCGALLPVVAAPIIYLSIFKRAAVSF